MSTISCLNSDSVTNTIGTTTKQVMVYGFESAHYLFVGSSLRNTGGYEASLRVYDAFLGVRSPRYTETVEGYDIEYIPYVESDTLHQKTKRMCKTVVTILMLENYKREKRGLPLIPLLFCVDSNTIPAKQRLTPESLTTKDKGINALCTHAELRRLYKLCKEFEESPLRELQDIARIAKETLKPVRVEIQQRGEIRLVSVPPIWDHPGWKQAWENRMSIDPSGRKNKALAKGYLSWRKQILERVQAFNARNPHLMRRVSLGGSSPEVRLQGQEAIGPDFRLFAQSKVLKRAKKNRLRRSDRTLIVEEYARLQRTLFTIVSMTDQQMRNTFDGRTRILAQTLSLFASIEKAHCIKAYNQTDLTMWARICYKLKSFARNLFQGTVYVPLQHRPVSYEEIWLKVDRISRFICNEYNPKADSAVPSELWS